MEVAKEVQSLVRTVLIHVAIIDLGWHEPTFTHSWVNSRTVKNHLVWKKHVPSVTAVARSGIDNQSSNSGLNCLPFTLC